MSDVISRIGKKYSVGTKLIRKENHSEWVISGVSITIDSDFYFDLVYPALPIDDINSTIEDISLEFLEEGFVIDEPMQRVYIDDFRQRLRLNSDSFNEWFVSLANKSNHNTIVIVDHENGDYHITHMPNKETDDE